MGHFQTRAGLKLLIATVLSALLCAIASPLATASVPTTYKGMGYISSPYGEPSVSAWRWTGTSWAAASLPNGSSVYLWPFSVDWEWAWTANTGWLATRMTNTSLIPLSFSSFSPGIEKWNGDFSDCAIPGEWDQLLSEHGTITVERAITYGGCAARVRQGPKATGDTDRIELHSYKTDHASESLPGPERWYSFRIYPLSFSKTSGGNRRTHINQWRTNEACYTGGTNVNEQVSPPTLEVRFNGGAITNSGSGCTYQFTRTIPLGNVLFNSWQTIQYHIKWSSSPATGFVEAWLDGKLVVPRTYLATTGNGATQLYWRNGIYAYDHPGTTEYILDDVRVFYPRG